MSRRRYGPGSPVLWEVGGERQEKGACKKTRLMMEGTESRLKT
jgi:hypothetical protein